ncbi:MAG TPA: LysR family transcriptional regulator [Burkholderiales bacterium]|jgi:DNA-binding transcriptional LysR family regulator|nr:LysR family transcriptional regulator [Burkholderiales bacterium]
MYYKDVCFFVKVVDSGNVGAASCKLGVSPSTISRKIAALEKKLKNQLIRRNNHSISLTEYGQNLYRSFREVSVEIEDFIGYMKSKCVA